jgi:preprotein translocase subunit SecE
VLAVCVVLSLFVYVVDNAVSWLFLRVL